MDAAKQKGGTLRTLGGLAQSIGQAMLTGGMGGGNAMVGFGGDPTGMAGSGAAPFMPGFKLPVSFS
jgi:hypothetical protein